MVTWHLLSFESKLMWQWTTWYQMVMSSQARVLWHKSFKQIRLQVFLSFCVVVYLLAVCAFGNQRVSPSDTVCFGAFCWLFHFISYFPAGCQTKEYGNNVYLFFSHLFFVLPALSFILIFHCVCVCVLTNLCCWCLQETGGSIQGGDSDSAERNCPERAELHTQQPVGHTVCLAPPSSLSIRRFLIPPLMHASFPYVSTKVDLWEVLNCHKVN